LRLSKPPSSIRTSPKPTAAIYAAATIARSNRDSSRPVGYARNTCNNTTGGNRWSSSPIVNNTSDLASERLETKAAKPARTISGPKRLSARRRHATRPQRTYESVIQPTRPARARGSRPSSAPSTSVTERAAAEQPARPNASSNDQLGDRPRPPFAPRVARRTLIPSRSFLTHGRRIRTNPSGTTGHTSRATDADERRRLRTRILRRPHSLQPLVGSSHRAEEPCGGGRCGARRPQTVRYSPTRCLT
jgi:hypothetical protein